VRRKSGKTAEEGSKERRRKRLKRTFGVRASEASDVSERSSDEE
jgi:hypothetical protein